MYASLGFGARVPNALLGPISLGIFVSLGVTLDSAETPFAKKTPFLGSSLILSFGGAGFLRR